MKQVIRTAYLFILFTINTTAPVIGHQIEGNSTHAVQAEWLEGLNNSSSLESFYSENSGIMINDELFIGIEAISKQLQDLINNIGQFNNYKPLEEHQLRNHQKFVLGEYKTINGDIYTAITAWSYKDQWTKDFEVFYKNSGYTYDGIDSVNQAREQWEKHSNAHRPELIVETVFSKNGKYLFRGSQYKNEKIIEAYSYMSNESYKIKLESLKTLQVNSEIIYDVGTFDTGGKGLYTLIWKKELGEWKLLLDFNF